VAVFAHCNLEKAIRTRQRCSKWFFKNDNDKPDSVESNTTHLNFIECLKDIQRQLSPFFETPKKSSKAVSDSSKRLESLSSKNAFYPLESADAYLYSEPDFLTIDNTPATSSGRPLKPAQSYQVETGKDEIQVTFFCLFEDVHRIHEFIKDTWSRCLASILDNTVAALVTEVALELMQKAKKSLVALAPEKLLEAGRRQYVSIIKHLYPGGDLNRVDGNENDRRTSCWAYIWEYSFLRSKDLIIVEHAPSAAPLFTKEFRSNPAWVRALKEHELCTTIGLDISHFIEQKNAGVYFHPEGSRQESRYYFPRPLEFYLDTISRDFWKSSYTVNVVLAARVILDVNAILGPVTEEIYTTLRVKELPQASFLAYSIL
jgi:hypothetical protein